jgi:hypothetical protein
LKDVRGTKKIWYQKLNVVQPKPLCLINIGALASLSSLSMHTEYFSPMQVSHISLSPISPHLVLSLSIPVTTGAMEDDDAMMNTISNDDDPHQA